MPRSGMNNSKNGWVNHLPQLNTFTTIEKLCRCTIQTIRISGWRQSYVEGFALGRHDTIQRTREVELEVHWTILDSG